MSRTSWTGVCMGLGFSVHVKDVLDRGVLVAESWHGLRQGPARVSFQHWLPYLIEGLCAFFGFAQHVHST